MWSYRSHLNRIVCWLAKMIDVGAAPLLIPLYASWLYTVTSYYDYWRNPSLYTQFPACVDRLVQNVYGWMPLSLGLTLLIRPVVVWSHPLWQEAYHAFLNLVLGEIWFYTLHRLLHQPCLFWLHRQHHELVTPVGALALYAHPVDAIGVNMGSMLLLHILIGFSFLQLLLIGSVATVSTILTSHTGRTGGPHQDHHRRYTVNYGTGLFMDRLFG